MLQQLCEGLSGESRRDDLEFLNGAQEIQCIKRGIGDRGWPISTAKEVLQVRGPLLLAPAFKTYYTTVRRSFRYKQPDLALQAEAVVNSARSRARRKTLLKARQSVLAEDEVGLRKCATIDLMSDEEDGIVGGVSGWIVRPPSCRSQELTELCATL
ncbi:unnamed protein product [Leuciscus chuanchicus]